LSRIDRGIWFQPKSSGLGLYADHLVKLAMLAVIFATVGAIVTMVRGPGTAALTVLAVTGAELAVFSPFTYRHARRSRE